MATINELKNVLKETLEKRGVLGQLKARIRAEVFSALDDQSEPRPPLSHENLLINELVREYLEYNKYKYTASVLAAEAGQPEIALDRQFLLNELNVVEDSCAKTVPILYGILAQFTNSSKDDGIKPLIHQCVSMPKMKKLTIRQPTEKLCLGHIPEPGVFAGTSMEDHFVLAGHQ
ncbi:lisH domain-containing protein FOPNL isoform X1 [Callorhinchus milii]|uniref:Centrosomal protein 20 n=2 Tax=Callorhinchus milii TaxID=7868 RepID=V9L338_CALMI|nr:lisH domain-containing protein FOPNL isoform X1 [Callorhinchus milii]|eukprot:gi/632952551/ref/XP_007891914.1/ PREDICTED: lisH domain-containing protein FOPNL [Callorhinchus milii]